MASKYKKYKDHEQVYSNNLWQDYDGAKWSKLDAAYYPDNRATYSYPLGKNSSSSYRPKSLFFAFNRTYSTSLDLNKAIVVLHVTKNTNNEYPSLKAYVGNSNAPYKKSPVCIVKKPYLVKTSDSEGYVHAYYKLSNVELKNFKNLICEFDWSRTKASGKSLVKVGWAGINVYTQKQSNKINLTSTVPHEVTYGDKVTWKIIATQKGTSGSAQYKINLPSNCKVVSKYCTGGTLVGDKWTVNLDKGKSSTLTYELQPYGVGYYEMDVSNYSTGAIYLEDYFIVDEYSPSEYGIFYTFYNDIYERSNGYYDIKIINYASDTSQKSYTMTAEVNDVNILKNPILKTAELLEDCKNIGDGLESGSGTLNFTPSHIGEFCLHLRIPIWSWEEGLAKIQTETEKGSFEILPLPVTVLDIAPSYNENKYGVVSSNIGNPSVWTILCKTNKHSFLQKNDESLSVTVEKPPAYIGCVKLSRGHSNDVNANVNNDLINERYRNRAYMGKKGNYDEEISMKLRIPPEDVTTLEGLVEFDKPVPIDTIPVMKDGNPLNHRGWAELYKISNIKKVNERLYDCEPSVKYLTHEINTEFQVTKDKAVYPTKDNEELYPTVHTYLSNVHKYTDKLGSILTPSPLGFYYDAEVDGGWAGAYEIPANNSIIFTSKLMQPYGNWNIKFRNTLPSLFSEDYDNNWKMAIRLKDTESDQVLFEHLYHTFEHFEDTETIVNKCKVTDTFWNGSSYETVNYSNMHLNKDNFAPEIDLNKANVTITMGGTGTITRGDAVTFTLTANDGATYVSNKIVRITLNNNLGYTETFMKMTDLYGVVSINDYVEGNCNVNVEFLETDEFKEASESFALTVNEPSTTATSFSYTLPEKVTAYNDTMEVTLLAGSNAITSADVYYSFCSLTENKYSAPIKLTTNAQGKITVPLQYNNGTQKLKLFYGGNATYSPCLVTELITIELNKDVYKVETDDMEYLMYDSNKQFSGIVTYKNNPVSNQSVIVKTYIDDQLITQTVTTNSNGVFTADLGLTYGLWFVDSIVVGTSNNATTSVTNTIKVISEDVMETSFVYDNEFTLTKTSDFPDGLFYVKLIDSKNEPIDYGSVTFTVKDSFLDVVQEITMKTNGNGYAYCPWYSETEDATIEFSYSGSVQYESCNGSARVLRASSTATGEATWNHIVNQEVTVNQSSIITDVTNTKELVYSISRNGSKVNNINYICIINNSVVFYGNTKNITGLSYDAVVGQNYSTVKTTMNGGIDIFEAKMSGNSCDVKIYYKDTNNVVKGGYLHEVVDLTGYTSDTWTRIPIALGGWGGRLELEGTDENEVCSLKTTVTTANGGSVIGEKIILKLGSSSSSPILVGVVENDTYVRFPIMREDLIKNCGESLVVTNSKIYVPRLQSEPLNTNSEICGLKARTKTAPTTSVTGFNYGAIQNITVTVNPSQVYGFDVEMIHINSSERYTLSLKTTDDGVNKLKLLTNKTGEWIVTIKFNDVNSSYGEDIYQTTVYGSALTNTYSNSLPIEDDLVVVDPVNNLGETFGSDVLLELRNGVLNLVDYGMVTNSTYMNGGKIFVNNYDLGSQSLMLEMEIYYDNILQQRIYPLEGLLQMQVSENNQTSAEEVAKYQNIVCSPSPVTDNLCRYTRHTSDGTIYFFDSKILDPVNAIEGVKYIGCPYNQFKGGCDLKTSSGISIFNLNNGYSPVYLDNGLVKIGFHRYSGYIELFRYDETNKDFCFVNALKIEDNPKLRLKDSGYSDDKITVLFGNTEWSIWRGRPYIQVMHKDTDMRLLNLNDRILCEKSVNSEGKEFIEDYDAFMSIFSPFNSVQKFKEDLHIGEDIREDAFSIERLNNDYTISEDTDTSEISLAKDTFYNDFAIKLEKEDDDYLTGVCFPSNGSYVAKPSTNFSLLVENMYGDELPIAVKCIGYVSTVQTNEVWSSTKSITPEYVSTKGSVSNYKFTCNWTNVPQNVKYISFILIFNDETITVFNRIMLYEGTESKEWSRDDSIQKATESTINFNNTCYAQIYDDKKDYGLGVVRPFKTSFNMRHITPSPQTLLIPYLKQAKPCDKIENLIVEYINSYEQVVSIESIGGYI